MRLEDVKGCHDQAVFFDTDFSSQPAAVWQMVRQSVRLWRKYLS